ncbi:amidase domain-containing protein [Amnibacterium endophyticum]|uniref:Amidase domain-containing protein n=1 Tax=Amnibacterium endophyticum TaxID=2109337 RepID=A0ABW4LCN5_9MICO
MRATRRHLLASAALGSAAMALSACSGSPVSTRAVDAVEAETVGLRYRGARSGSVRGGDRIVLHGTDLGAARTARIGGVEVPLVRQGAASVVATSPAAVDFRSGEVEVALLDADRHEVASTTWTYRAVDGVDRQLEYVLTYWKDYNPAYQRLGDTDCVDFTSQSLLERGWEQQGTWTHAEQVVSSGPAWISSTAFRDFMTLHPELGTALTDDQRDRVKLGDVVQFDWDGSGDRDHTGVVTRITTEGGRTRIGYAGHTKDSDYRDVDESITIDHPGGTAFYWSLA